MYSVQCLHSWSPRSLPTASRLEGRYVVLEKLDFEKHHDEIYALHCLPDAAERMASMPEGPLVEPEAFKRWLASIVTSTDPAYYAVIDKASGKVGGYKSLRRMDTENGVVEIYGATAGYIRWAPHASGHPATTEGFYLFARYVFDELGYRRLEWTCNNLNVASKEAAMRLG